MPWLIWRNLKSGFGPVAVLALLAFLGAACSQGPLDPDRLAQIKSRDEYGALAKSRVSHDEIYFLNTAGETLWVDALPLTADLLAAGQTRWADDKRHAEILKKWLPLMTSVLPRMDLLR